MGKPACSEGPECHRPLPSQGAQSMAGGAGSHAGIFPRPRCAAGHSLLDAESGSPVGGEEHFFGSLFHSVLLFWGRQMTGPHACWAPT